MLSPDRVLCLTTDCIATVDEVEQMEKMMEEWDDWVRPAICVSIMVTVVIFFSFMYFGRSWMEGTARVRWHEIKSLWQHVLVLVDLQKIPKSPEGGSQQQGRWGWCWRRSTLGEAEDWANERSRKYFLLHSLHQKQSWPQPSRSPWRIHAKPQQGHEVTEATPTSLPATWTRLYTKPQ